MNVLTSVSCVSMIYLKYMRKLIKSSIIFFVIIGLFLVFFLILRSNNNLNNNKLSIKPVTENMAGKQRQENADSASIEANPMAIQNLRDREYLGGDFVIEKKLANGTNYQQYIASYKSEGLKIFGLLTVPLAVRLENGFPAIIFVHGYIQPDQYSTTGNYSTYQARLARSGFVTFKPDLRGHGNSEGEAVGAHYSEKYVVDTLYAIEYLKKYKDVDPNRIGYWGHSNGGEIGLRAVVISSDVKAASFWAGVVGNQKDMLETYNKKIGFMRNATSTELVLENGLPSENPDFWNKLDPYAFLGDISAPIQLQHGTADESVPIELSLRLKEELEKLNKSVEYFEYKGDNHNISNNVGIAFQRTIDFYKKYLTPVIEKVGSKEILVQDNKNSQTGFLSPLDRSKKRVTKKTFGMYITPATSPVQPENFSGYHAGVDFEIFPDELNVDVPVKAVCSGQLELKEYANGYGGVMAQSCALNNEPITVIYGHLNLASLKFNKGDNINTGEEIGILGKDKSIETDGERKHLHLGFHIGSGVNIKGYVNTEAELRDWLNPCLYVCID